MNTHLSLSLSAEDRPTPKVHRYDDRSPIGGVKFASFVDLMATDPAPLFALAAAALLAAQQLEAAIAEHAARQVNEGNAETDSQPFGTQVSAARVARAFGRDVAKAWEANETGATPEHVRDEARSQALDAGMGKEYAASAADAAFCAYRAFLSVKAVAS